MDKKIKSFQVDHTKLVPGLYISRVDGDCVTYDLRMKKPNSGNYINVASMHSMEHMLATELRFSSIGDKVVYVGPMGCRTGMYVIIRDSVSPIEFKEVLMKLLTYISEDYDYVPGVSNVECGNCREHDFEGAIHEIYNYLRVLEDTDSFEYP